MTPEERQGRAEAALLGAVAGLAMAADKSNVAPKLPGPAAAAAELMALSGRWLLAADGHFEPQAVADLWTDSFGDSGDPAGLGPAEKDALRNLREGLRPPASGCFSAYRVSGSAAVRAVPCGIFWHGREEEAAEAASLDAQVSHAYEGLWGARAAAAAVAAALGSDRADQEAVVEAAMRAVPDDSWLHYRIMECCDLVSDFAGLEALVEELRQAAKHLHLTADLAVVSVPLALALYLRSGSDPGGAVAAAAAGGGEAPVAAALVGALVGATAGLEALPAGWGEQAVTLPGETVKAVAGESLTALAGKLLELRQSVERQMSGREDEPEAN